MDRTLTVAGVALAAHLLANLAHGVVHGVAPVPLTSGQSAFVVGVVTVAPVLGFGLAWCGAERVGWTVFALAMTGSLVFGPSFHFLVPNPDHVHSVSGAWSGAFSGTAVLIAVADALGAVVGGWLALAPRRSSPGQRHPRESG